MNGGITPSFASIICSHDDAMGSSAGEYDGINHLLYVNCVVRRSGPDIIAHGIAMGGLAG